MNQIVLAWMRQSDPPVLPIIAGSTTEQVAENIAALAIKLSEDQMRRLDAAGGPAAGGWIQPSWHEESMGYRIKCAI